MSVLKPYFAHAIFNHNTHDRKMHNPSVFEKQNRFKCLECDSTFVRIANVNRQIVSVHKQDRCHECDHNSTENCNLKQHISSVHKQKKKFQCNECHYASSNQTNIAIYYIK